MAKPTTNELAEGFSLAGTFLFSQKEDAEKVAEMLDLKGAFPIQSDENTLFWMPGNSYEELMKRINSSWILPEPAAQPQTFKQENLTPFHSFIHRDED